MYRFLCCFFFMGTAPPEIYTYCHTLSLHDSLPICDADAAKNYVVAGYVLPGNNYHVYDITLFWANVRADVLRRLATYEGKPSPVPAPAPPVARSEEHTSELQSLMRISYAVFCLKKKTSIQTQT